MLKFIFSKRVLFLFLSFQIICASEIVIGKFDRIDLPELKLQNIRIKADTGAKTSSLHCSFIKLLDEKRVSFEVLDKTHKKYRKKRYIMPIVRIANVKSSNGHVEERYVISTKIIIFNKSYDTEFTLRNRKKMNYPILLGREFLQQGFLVDVSKEYLSYTKKQVKGLN
jgi:hypothetical protein